MKVLILSYANLQIIKKRSEDLINLTDFNVPYEVNRKRSYCYQAI